MEKEYLEHLREYIGSIYDIATYELNSNYHREDHIDYIIYRLTGGKKDETNWFIDQCTNKS